MIQESFWESDHHGFLLVSGEESRRCYLPLYEHSIVQNHLELIHATGNQSLYVQPSIIVPISAGVKASLNWNIEPLLLPEATPIVWEFKDLVHPTISKKTSTLPIEHFSSNLYPKHKKAPQGAILYRGSFPSLEPALYIDYEEWQANTFKDAPDIDPLFSQRLFLTHRFYQKLAPLLAWLPTACLPIILLKLDPTWDLATISMLFSSRIFARLSLALWQNPLPLRGLSWGHNAALGGIIASSNAAAITPPCSQVTQGVLLPSFTNFSKEVAKKLNDWLQAKAGTISFRIICEESLHEEWDGIETLFDPCQIHTIEGDRALKGFLASGGVVQKPC